MRESQYTAAIGRKLPPSVYALKLSLPYTAGVPDSWYSGRGGDLWVEYKYLDAIPRLLDLTGGASPIITKLQQAWLRDRHYEGRTVAVIVGSPLGGVILPGLDWMIPVPKEAFEAAAKPHQEVADWITACTDLEN